MLRSCSCSWRTAACPSLQWCSSVSFRAFDDLREAVEPLQPRADALEGVGREHAPADTADLLRGHELRVLEQPDVLLHSGQRHAEGLGELADRRAAGAEPFEDGAAGRVAEGCKRAVDGRRILNHKVHYSDFLRCLVRVLVLPEGAGFV